jgi:hypothetical protein
VLKKESRHGRVTLMVIDTVRDHVQTDLHSHSELMEMPRWLTFVTA